MSEPFIAQVQIFPYNFAPRGWAFCDGQLLPLSQNTALFALIGTLYGGDGRTTFGLPDLKGRAVVHPGNGPGLSPRTLGQRGGVENVTLSEAQMASHRHTMQASGDDANSLDPAGILLARSQGGSAYQTDSRANLVQMDQQALPNAGGGGAHNNLQPYSTLHFCIALAGLYPRRL